VSSIAPIGHHGLVQPFATVRCPAQTGVPAPLPPAAQEALNKGIIAAKVPDYPLAIRFFEDARKIAPWAPVIFLNLGIAESKMPGRELRAIAWFGAYLAASPDAPNAAAVKEQIAVLDARSQSNVSRLIKALQDAARQSDRRHDLDQVAELWAKAGDISAALKIADRQNATYLVGGTSTYVVIALVQAERGDSSGAQKTLDLIRDTYEKTNALLSIAESQSRSGNIADAKRFLTSAQKTAALVKGSDGKSRTQRDIAITQDKIATANANAPIATHQSTTDAQPAIQPAVTASDWLNKLDDRSQNGNCP
jgi:tetratricopeptide (TPR) repeat protein